MHTQQKLSSAEFLKYKWMTTLKLHALVSKPNLSAANLLNFPFQRVLLVDIKLFTLFCKYMILFWYNALMSRGIQFIILIYYLLRHFCFKCKYHQISRCSSEWCRLTGRKRILLYHSVRSWSEERVRTLDTFYDPHR